jgi:NO-binding membrane sensor protein with MHYT domain
MLEIEYDPTLVGVSIAVAIWGSWTAFVLSFGIRSQDRTTFQKAVLCINSAVVMGGSIWAMHFIAMLAVGFPVIVSFNALETVGSLILAIAMCGLGLFVALEKSSSPLGALGGGTFMGLGMTGMHYLGICAIRGCEITFGIWGVASSMLVAVLASSAALWIVFRTRGIAQAALGGIIMGLAISSMHYIGMSATAFVSSPSFVAASSSGLSQSILAYAIAMAAIAVCAAQLLMASGASTILAKKLPGIS